MSSPNPESPSGLRPNHEKRPIKELVDQDPSSDESSTSNIVMRRLKVGEESALSPSKHDDKGDPYACPVCDKSFSKCKALFGHMRCHPHCYWRGISPNRLPMGTRAVSREEREVVGSLMLLANGGDDEEVEGEGEGEKKGEGNLKFYLCSLCKRAFGSRQALGGHRASHRNVKGCYAVGKGELGERSNKGEGDKNAEGKDKEEENNDEEMREFKCDLCGRLFINAQGLGSHKKVHTSDHQGDDQIVAPPPSPKRDYRFDLNMPPHEEEDEENDKP